MIRKNYYKRITESIVKAYHDNNLDSAMEHDEPENMGKKIVAIITADPDQDLDWDSEYEPFGQTELSQDDEDEAYAYEYGEECDGEDCEHGDECDEPVIGSGFEDEVEYEDEVDEDDTAEELENITDVLMDIRDELSHLHAADDDFEDVEIEDISEDEDDGESALEAPESEWDEEESEDEDIEE